MIVNKFQIGALVKLVPGTMPHYFGSGMYAQTYVVSLYCPDNRYIVSKDNIDIYVTEDQITNI